jgi:DUF1365 family protein
MSADGQVSGLYSGVVTHARLRPRVHRLRYKIFMILIDLDEAAALSGKLKLFSYNKPGLIALNDRDHLDGSDTPLADQVREELARAGLDFGGGPVRLLCMPRVLGFVFNPISVYFCHRADGRLGAILYEVNNTFGQRHAYLIPVRPQDCTDGEVAQSCDKRFHVSPFMDMAMRYHFATAVPGEDVRLAVDSEDASGPMFTAGFRGLRRDLSDGAVARAVLAHPMLALAVLAAIHWEAIKMLMKGLRLKPMPPAPAERVTLVH